MTLLLVVKIRIFIIRFINIGLELRLVISISIR